MLIDHSGGGARLSIQVGASPAFKDRNRSLLDRTKPIAFSARVADAKVHTRLQTRAARWSTWGAGGRGRAGVGKRSIRRRRSGGGLPPSDWTVRSGQSILPLDSCRARWAFASPWGTKMGGQDRRRDCRWRPGPCKMGQPDFKKRAGAHGEQRARELRSRSRGGEPPTGRGARIRNDQSFGVLIRPCIDRGGVYHHLGPSFAPACFVWVPFWWEGTGWSLFVGTA